MGEREDLVYQAKLAEQAERYDGKTHFQGCKEGDMFAAGILFCELSHVNEAVLN